FAAVLTCDRSAAINLCNTFIVNYNTTKHVKFFNLLFSARRHWHRKQDRGPVISIILAIQADVPGTGTLLGLIIRNTYGPDGRNEARALRGLGGIGCWGHG